MRGPRTPEQLPDDLRRQRRYRALKEILETPESEYHAQLVAIADALLSLPPADAAARHPASRPSGR